MIEQWDDMVFWNSGEHQVVQEHLNDLRKARKVFNPSQENLYAALDAVPFDKVKVAIIGQDPYPDHHLSTGIAFDIPSGVKIFPPTLENLFREYCDDLQHPFPKSGSLKKWCDEGVLLWNVIPSCEAGKPKSHYGWIEWGFLNREIFRNLSERGIVFAFLGGVAREYVKFVDDKTNVILETSHPSPRGNLNSRVPFLGSRLFSTINDKLVNTMNMTAINWKL